MIQFKYYNEGAIFDASSLNNDDIAFVEDNNSLFTHGKEYKFAEDMEVDVIDANGHDYVDLGLPSGTLWATMNVGANSITDTGLYFQWGDISGYTASQVGSDTGQKYFGWADYKYGNGTSSPGPTGMTKYNSTDGKTVLEASDDAVTVNMGGNWHMPTEAQFQELLNITYVTNAWVTNYQGSGVNGRLFTSVADNTKTLFFPAAGYCNDGSVSKVGILGNVWSRSVFESSLNCALYMSFGSGGLGVNVNDRYYGCSVRGVVEPSKGPKYATKAELDAKQDVIDSSHKLNADLIENGTTNKVINVKPDWNAASGNDAEILNKPSLATVATSGSYNDLSNKPTIPSLSGYATLTYVGLQISYTLGYKQSVLSNGNIYNSPMGAISVESDRVSKLTNVNTLEIDCTNIHNSSHRAVLLLQTGSNPDISFVYNRSNDNNNDFYGTTGIMYAGSSGVFLANSKYIIYFIGSNEGCIITQFKLSDTPVAGENGVEETTGGGPGWRTIEGSNYSGEILVNSAGEVVTVELPETVFYRYLNNGSYLAVCDSFLQAIPPADQLVASTFGTQTYNCTLTSINSSHKFTLTIDGTEYVITYDNNEHTIVTSPELSTWSPSKSEEASWRMTSNPELYILVNSDGDIINLEGLGYLYKDNGYIYTSSDYNTNYTPLKNALSELSLADTEYTSDNKFTIGLTTYKLQYLGKDFTISPEITDIYTENYKGVNTLGEGAPSIYNNYLVDSNARLIFFHLGTHNYVLYCNNNTWSVYDDKGAHTDSQVVYVPHKEWIYSDGTFKFTIGGIEYTYTGTQGYTGSVSPSIS